MSMAVGDRDENEPMMDMNTTPLIDVMLVLLIMFIITIPVQTHAVKIDLPVPTDSQSNVDPEKNKVMIDPAGTITWNGTPVDLAQLAQYLEQTKALPVEPELHPEPGFEGEVHAFNLFAFLSRSQVTWNPSFTSVVKYSYMCPTTEEHILPILHSNDRVEWFFQMSDEIAWDCAHRDSGKPMARVIMKAGDMAAMPAYCRHQGYSPKRSMLLVWENGSPNLVYEIQKGEAPEVPVQF